MNFDKIYELCATLHLSDEEGPMHSVGSTVKIEGSKKLALSLVGELLAGHQTNRNAFRVLIPKNLRLTSDVSIELVRDNIFAFHFQNTLDNNRVLAGTVELQQLPSHLGGAKRVRGCSSTVHDSRHCFTIGGEDQ
ncbi:hypothetical protein ACOSQ2_026707 [Xanthoceras sorbifolium]